MRLRGYRLLLAGSAIACASALDAGETVTYGYDALGRLVRVERSGSVNQGVNASYGYDCAGNRAQAAAGPGVPPAPPPPPCGSSPPGGNQPPVALNDSGSQPRCSTQSHAVTGNDSDPDGDYPLTVTAVSGTGFSIASATTIQFVSGSSTGGKSATYTVRDSRGATASATLTVNVTAGICE